MTSCLKDHELGFAAASSFSTGPSFHKELETAVGPLSMDLLSGYGSHDVTKTKLAPRQWAIIVLKVAIDHPWQSDQRHDFLEIIEASLGIDRKCLIDPDKVYYALVSPSDDGSGRFHVVDMKEYLRRKGNKDADHLAKWWQDVAEPEPYVHFYDKPDIQDLLKLVFFDVLDETKTDAKS